MKQKLTTSSANGQNSRQQFLKSTGRAGHFTAISPTLLPTPNALDYINSRSLEALRRAKEKGGCHNMKDLISHPQEYGVVLPPTARDTKRSLYSQEDSPASHSAKLDEEKARQMTVTSGLTCFELYKTSSQTGSSLKMCVGLLLGTKEWYSSRCALTWKAKVTKSNRLLFQLAPSTPRTAGKGSGLLPTVQTQGLKVCKNGKSIPMMLPTPDASDGRRGPAKTYNPRAKSQSGRTVTTLVGSGTGEKLRLQPAMPEWMMGFPEKWTEFPTASPNGETNRSKPTVTQ